MADETTESLEKRVAEVLATSDTDDNILPPKSVTYTDYDDPLSFVKESSGAPHIAKMSSHSWVGCGEDIYVLECMGKGFIRIDPVKATAGTSFTSLYRIFIHKNYYRCWASFCRPLYARGYGQENCDYLESQPVSAKSEDP